MPQIDGRNVDFNSREYLDHMMRKYRAKSWVGNAKWLRYLRENDLNEYHRIKEQRKWERRVHSMADWDDIGHGGYLRKKHDLAEVETCRVGSYGPCGIAASQTR